MERRVLMKIGCVVMASGSAKRFGSNKLLAPLCGKPLLTHTLENIPKELFAEIAVVTIHKEIASLAENMGFESLLHKSLLQNHSVKAGIEKMKAMDGCMFCVSDQPLCSGETMKKMINAFSEQPKKIVRLFSGGIQGNPVIFPNSLFPLLEKLPKGRGGSAVAAQFPHLVVPVEAASPYEMNDVDSPESLAQMEKLMRELKK